jgi:glycosyltransferase involved in cell wall biosynthesis
VPPDDVDALAAALAALLADAALRRRMGAAGRARVEAQFTWAHVAERMLPLLTRFAIP